MTQMIMLFVGILEGRMMRRDTVKESWQIWERYGNSLRTKPVNRILFHKDENELR